MKKLRTILTFLPALGLGVALLLPAQTQAINFNQFKQTYQGTWENTYDECGDIGETGIITIVLTKIKKKAATRAKVKDATVYFSDGSYGGLAGTGKIFKKNKKLKIRLNYGTTAPTDYYLTGTISKKKLNGMYYHSDAGSGCSWSGTIAATRYTGQ